MKINPGRVLILSTATIFVGLIIYTAVTFAVILLGGY